MALNFIYTLGHSAISAILCCHFLYPISEISPQELHSSLNPSSSPKSPIIIDVREKDEQLRGIIPTAIPLPRGILERDVERKVISVKEVNDLENGRNIVVYCAGGLRR